MLEYIVLWPFCALCLVLCATPRFCFETLVQQSRFQPRSFWTFPSCTGGEKKKVYKGVLVLNFQILVQISS